MHNLSVTFRNVGNRTAALLESKIIKLMDQHNVKSAHMRVDDLDVGEIEEQQVVVRNVGEKNYILQGKDASCRLITLLNACIHKTGKSPIKYRSKRFFKLCEKCGGGVDPLIDIDPALKELKLSLKRNRTRSLESLKKWIIKELKKGNLVDYALWHPRWNAHSVLIVDHKRYNNVRGDKVDVFKCINAQLNTEKTPVEYLSWKQLTAFVAGTKGLKKNTLQWTEAVIFTLN